MFEEKNMKTKHAMNDATRDAVKLSSNDCQSSSSLKLAITCHK